LGSKGARGNRTGRREATSEWETSHISLNFILHEKVQRGVEGGEGRKEKLGEGKGTNEGFGTCEGGRRLRGRGVRKKTE